MTTQYYSQSHTSSGGGSGGGFQAGGGGTGSSFQASYSQSSSSKVGGKTSMEGLTRGLYEPHTRKNNVVIQRVSMSSGGGGSLVSSKSSRVSSGIGLSLPAGAYQSISNQGVVNMKMNREKERKEMQDLNVRLGSVIEELNYLRAENQQLKNQLKQDVQQFDPEPMKKMFTAEIEVSKQLLDETQIENGHLKVQLQSKEDEYDDLRNRLLNEEETNAKIQCQLDTLNDDISRRASEIDMLQRRANDLEQQVFDWKKKYQNLDLVVQGLRVDLNNETCLRLDECSKVKVLEDELAFLKEITQAEIKEWKNLSQKDKSVETREFWKNELSKCVRDLQNEYDTKLQILSSDMESRYSAQVDELRAGSARNTTQSDITCEENKKLRSQFNDKDTKIKDLETQLAYQISKCNNLAEQLDAANNELSDEKALHTEEVSRLRCELECVLKELQQLLDMKLSLELEIAAYRKLLECEETRLSMKNITQTAGGFQTNAGQLLVSALGDRSQQAASGGITQQTVSSSYQSVNMSQQGQTTQSQTSVQRGQITKTSSTKGTVAISELETYGRYVELENISTQQTMDLSGWKLRREPTNAGKNETDIVEEMLNLSLARGQKIKLWGKAYAVDRLDKSEPVATVAEFNLSRIINNNNSKIRLIDRHGVDQATVTVKLVNV